MKKRFLGLVLCVAMLISVIPSVALPASAVNYIFGADLFVDVPVAGLSLNKKGDVEVGVAYMNNDLVAYNDPMDIFKVESITWYEVNSSGTKKLLSEGHKAELGKKYYADVLLSIKDSGYDFTTTFPNFKGTLINGKTPELVMFWGDNQYVEYCMTFDCIPASTVKPTVVIKEMELAPYEGQPAEIKVEVVGGTNVRYQWQIIYGDNPDGGSSLEFSGKVNISDGGLYEGCRTPHFKMHTYYGNTFDENDILKIRCEVTSDNGTAYSQPVWYTIIDCEEVTSASFTGVTAPQFGANPDLTAVTGDSSKYTVTGVDWLGPKNSDGSYTSKVIAGDKFKAGVYKCRIKVSTTEKYKFSDSATATIGGGSANITVIEGSDDAFVGPDKYYIEREYTVNDLLYLTSVNVSNIDLPEVGTHPDFTYSLYSTHINVNSVNWYKCSQSGNKTSGALNSGYLFEKDSYYRVEVSVSPASGYGIKLSDLDFYINGKAVNTLQNGNSFVGYKIYHVSEIEGTYSLYMHDCGINKNTIIKDGEYLGSGSTTPTTVMPSGGYAYYKSGVLQFNNYNNPNASFVFEEGMLDLYLIGSNTIGSICDNSYVVDSNALPNKRDGSLSINATSGGSLVITGNAVDAYASLYVANTLHFNGGEVTVNKGTNYGYNAKATDVTVSSGYSVYVGNSASFASATLWNGTTAIDKYKNLWVVKKQASSAIKGDVNNDGYIDNLDAATILKYDAGIIDLVSDELLASDVNGDGYADNLDAAMILKYDAGIIDSL